MLVFDEFPPSLPSGPLVSCGGEIYKGGHIWTGAAFVDKLHADSEVKALVEYDGLMVAGGYFNACGGDSLGHLAAWDGATWRPVGTGCNDKVRTMVEWNDRLWIGGDFTIAGGVPAFELTNWTIETPLSAPATPPAELALDPPRPNPFNPRTTLRFSVPRDGHVTMILFDLRGRRVRDLVRGNIRAGEHTAAWDGRDQAGREVAAGVYLVKLTADSRIRTARLTLVR